VEYRFKRQSGDVVWAASTARLITDQKGRPLRLIGALQNITGRKTMEEQIAGAIRQAAASVEAKRALLEAIAADIGAAPPIPHDIAPNEMAPNETPKGSDLLGDLASLLSEVEARDRALKDAVNTLRASRTAAQAATLAKSRFIASMSHELRTPLNAVIGFAEILEEDLTDAGLARPASDVARIRDAAKHLLAIITDILAFTEIETGQSSPEFGELDVGALLDEVTRAHEAAARQRANTLVLKREPLPNIATDAARLRRCIDHLVDNACKFTEQGAIEISAKLDRGSIWIRVKDTGPGIAPEKLDGLFEPLTQGDASFTRARDGAGMGLALCRKLAGFIGGEVSVATCLGQGSTFTLRIPAAERAHPRKMSPGV
jgi:signal transduction histidine kinase